MLRIHYQLLSQKLFYCYVAHCSDRIRSPSFLMPSITNGHRMHPPFFMIACCLPRHETFLQNLTDRHLITMCGSRAPLVVSLVSSLPFIDLESAV